MVADGGNCKEEGAKDERRKDKLRMMEGRLVMLQASVGVLCQLARQAARHVPSIGTAVQVRPDLPPRGQQRRASLCMALAIVP
jgi:hypothetical protein